MFGIKWFDKAASRVFPEMHRDGTGDDVVACFGQARFTDGTGC